MGACIFCKILNKEIPTEVVFEDDIAFAFLDAMPRAPGHTLVIPKAHTDNLIDMRPPSVGPFFERVQLVLRKVKKGLEPDAFTLGINHGKWAGQAVDHLHFHIIPRWRDDGGHSIHSVVMNPPTESLNIIADRIRGVK